MNGTRRWTDGDVSVLQQAVVHAAEGTPYEVFDTEKGFEVQLRLSDARWRDVFGTAGLRRTFCWKVREHRSYFTITDSDSSVRWRVGVPGLAVSMSKQSGRIFSLSRTKIWGLGPDGAIVPVADYRFNSREGRDLIRLAARQLGLTERLPWVLTGANIAIATGGFIPALLFLSEWLMRTVGGRRPPPGRDLLPISEYLPLAAGLLVLSLGVAATLRYLWRRRNQLPRPAP